ncbi:MAG: hypothetical protein ACJ750_03040 [Gaiellaceae bacterium]
MELPDQRRCSPSPRTGPTSRSHCDPGRPLRIELDHHLFGVFPDATWRRLIDDSGLEFVDGDDPDADEHVVFVGRRPVGGEIPAQIEAA